ncbi:MAG: YraN family protein [Chitinivibrionia bacterium]|nr:YraN family protein [Chitinivibrionia bacterium]
MNTRKVGADGEQKAIDFLIANGYEIIEKNVHFGKTGEIDIIAKEIDETVVFVEVKYNRSAKGTFGEPEFRCNAKKIKQITKLANIYIYDKKLFGKPVRIDVIAIDDKGLRHYKNCLVM